MRSMTGYGYNKYSDDNYDIEVEIKSLNNRYLDLEVKMKYTISNYEFFVRDFINERIKRGKVTISINYEDKNKNKVEIDSEMIKYLFNVHNEMNKELELKQEFHVQDAFSIDGVLMRKSSKVTDESFQQALLDALTASYKEYDAMSQKEGENIKVWFESFQSLNKKGINEIKAHLPNHRASIKEKVYNAVNDVIKQPLCEEVEKRLMVELSLYMDR